MTATTDGWRGRVPDRPDARESWLGAGDVRLRSLIEHALDLITVVRPDGTIAYESPSIRAILGYAPDELVGHPALDYIHPEDVPRVAGLLRWGFEHLGRITTGEFRVRHRDGTWRVLEAIGKSVVDGGEVVGIINSRDITQRKQAEEERRTLWRAVAQSPNSIVITDATGRIQYVNPKFCEVSGYTAGELIGATPGLLKSGDTPPAVYEELWATITAGREWSGELQNRRKDGKTLWESVSISPVVQDDGRITHFIGIKQDITARKEADEAMRRQRETLFQNEKLAAMGQLLAGVAHELNNPLSVVLGRSGLLGEVAAGTPLAAQADKIAQAADRCARIVKNFLALARQRLPERRATDVNRVIRDAVELLAYALRVDDVAVTLELDEGVPTLWADPHQLHQVVLNLVANAHQALREVAPPRRRRITVSSRFVAGEGAVTIDVADTGPGIPPGIMARIFEPFFTTKPPGQGTGLGLSLCQGIVENHDGTIDVDSEPGVGTVFHVRLPARGLPAAAEERSPGASPVRDRRILIVDDEPEVLHLLSDLLVRDGHTVVLAEDGRAALERLRAEPFDVVITDVRMPGLDGPGLYREVARLGGPGMARRMVFVTGDTFSDETKRFLEQTGAPSLAKPFSQQELQDVLRQAWARRAADAEPT